MTAFPPRRRALWQLRTRTLPLGERTLLMGIVNITPDSFSDGGQFLSPAAAVSHALRLLDQGADLLDLGAESTRPNATPLSPAAEQARLLPVLTRLRALRPDAILSVDTYHAQTAARALAAGAEIVNDVSGLLWDPLMAQTLAATPSGAILMHTRGHPTDWQALPPIPPGDVVPLIGRDMLQILTTATEAGIPLHRIVVDPGFGFGKLGPENFELHAHLAQLTQLGCPLLVGTSRKRFLTATLAPALDQAEGEQLRGDATTASQTAAILAGAHILRVHDIPPARAAAHVADAILRSLERKTAGPQPDTD